MEKLIDKIIINDANNDIIIRTGEAKKISYPQRLTVYGAIDTPLAYVKYREKLIDKDKAICMINKSTGKIVFYADYNDEYADCINGSLYLNPELEDFHINVDKIFNLNDLTKLLRMKRLYFANKDVHSDFLTKLMDFKASISKSIESANDNRGNSKQVVDQVVNTHIPPSFVLKMPIFTNTKDSIFKVDICMASRDSQIDFWLESIELRELIESQTEQLIGNQIEGGLNKYLCIYH